MKSRRICSLLLIAALIVSLFSVNVFADDIEASADVSVAEEINTENEVRNEDENSSEDEAVITEEDDDAEPEEMSNDSSEEYIDTEQEFVVEEDVNNEEENEKQEVKGSLLNSSGKCGENVTWQLSDEGILRISGTGDMYDYQDNDYDKVAKSINRRHV